MPSFFRAKTGIAKPFFKNTLVTPKSRGIQVPYGVPKRFIENNIKIPLGLIVAYEGTAASIPENWVLCDGTLNTPDLTDHMVVGADQTFTFNSTGGNVTQAIALSVATNGTHVGSGNLGIDGGGVGAQRNVFNSSNHTSSCTISNRPDHRTLLYIMATGSLEKLPKDASLFLNDDVANIIQGFSEFIDSQGRFYQGVNSDTRSNVDGNLQSVTVTTSTAGLHLHSIVDAASFSGSGKLRPTGNFTGNHAHTGGTTLGITLPPYHVLVGVKADEEAPPQSKMVAMYFGDLGDLDSRWQNSDGTNGSPDLRGRFAMAEDRSAFNRGDSAGSTSRSVSGSTISSSWTHSHLSGEIVGTGVAHHNNQSISHSHTLSGGAVAVPKYRALYYIYLAA